MTKEEAIKWLTNLKSDIGKMQFRALWGYEQAMDEILKLLSAEPSEDVNKVQTSAEPSGDLISRQLLIGAIEKCGEEKIYPQALIETINALPSADRPKGEWLWRHGGECSECGFHNNNFDFNYCPNCGAKMKGE